MRQVRYIPSTLFGWDPSADKLEGTEVYGTPPADGVDLVSTAAWAIAFSQDDFETFKVESADDPTTYQQEYNKATLIGRSMNTEALLADNTKIEEKDGAGVYHNTWKRVRHIPASTAGWDLANDKLKGDETFGTEDVDSSAWAIAFSSIDFIKFKVESGDGSYKVEYFKNQVLEKLGVADTDGNIAIEPFLIDNTQIAAKGGANVYIS